MSRVARTAGAVAVAAWPLLLALVLCAPMYAAGGALLARDLVFLPRQTWTDATWGIGDQSARAVPLDAVVAALTTVVDGRVLARVVLPLVLALAGWGAQRLVAYLLADRGASGVVTARLVAGGAAVWNPFVVERLALGQWALLAGYAALPWVALAATRYAAGGGRRSACAVLAWWALASLTPTGGLLAGAVAVVLALPRRTSGPAARAAWRGWAAVVLGGLVLQLPWLVPSLTAAGTTLSDPAGVEVFAAGAEGGGSVLLALLGLGGIWDARSVPATRDAWGAPVAAALVVLVLALAWRRLAPGPRGRLAAVAGGGFLLAALPHLPGGSALLGWLVATVPGGGLLRDGQKLLGPLVVLVAVAAGAAAGAAAYALRRHGSEVVASVALVLVGAPLLVLPDATTVTWPTVTPVRLPAYDAVADVVDDGPPGDVATLPWRSYRLFDWGGGLVSSDPAPRLLDARVLVSDRLQVGDVLLDAEAPRSAALGEALDSEPVAQALADAGVAWALVHLDDPAAAGLDLAGLEPAYVDDDLALYRVPDAAPAPPGASTVRRVLAVGAHLAALAVALGAILGAVLRRAPRRDRSDAPGSV